MNDKSVTIEPKKVLRISPDSLKNMSEEDQKILAEFMRDQVNNKGIHYWKKDIPYSDEQGNTLIFAYDSIQRERKESNLSEGGIRFEMNTDKILGVGGGGVVTESIGTVAIDEAGKVIFKDKIRAIKIGGEHVNVEPGVAGELIGKKKPVEFQSKKFAVAMKLIKGKDLSEMVSSFSHFTTGPTVHKVNLNFSLAEKKELTVALLQAFKSQIIEKNIVHRDIKPANIRVNILNGTSFALS